MSTHYDPRTQASMDANYTFASMHNLAKSEQIAAIAFRTELFQLGQISQLIWTEHT